MVLLETMFSDTKLGDSSISFFPGKTAIIKQTTAYQYKTNNGI